MAELLNWLFGQYAVYSTLFIALELIAVIFGVSSVLLASKTNILVFPIGLVSTAIFVYLLWKWQLFGDMFINAYYSIMSIYGWINWTQNKHNTDIKKHHDHINPTSQQQDAHTYNADAHSAIDVEHLNKKDENDIFNIANNFGIRHHNKDQQTEYDKAIWYSWIFYYYLATVHAVLRMTNKK